MVRPQVGDVEALDPHGQRVQLERVLQGGERVHPLLAPPLGPQLVLSQGQPGVALCELPQAPLVAPLGDAHLDRAAAAVETAPPRAGRHDPRSAGPTTTSRGTAGTAE